MKRIILLLCISFLGLSISEGQNSRKQGLLEKQIRYFQGLEFQNRGIKGQGIRIAILDGGFPGVDTHEALRHLIDRKQIIATRNFVHGGQNVFTGVAHGTQVLGCIAGIVDGQPLGLAPDAEFLLALTEERGEPLKEEINWAKAVDWAIEQGADIIQSSLGYTYHRYFVKDLDGKTSIAAQAALRAARKGILLVNCMGNEGGSKWQTLVTPADADSILSVGAIDPDTGLASSFTSIGPTADKRLKPNVCAPGTVVTINPKGGTIVMSGTSFSSPLIAGFAACTWQMNPELNAQQVLNLVEQSGHLFPYYDYSHGYGIPQTTSIIERLTPPHESSIMITEEEDAFFVNVLPENSGAKRILPERYLYYHFSDSEGYLIKYGVYKVDPGDSIAVPKTGCNGQCFFRCNYNGVTNQWKENR